MLRTQTRPWDAAHHVETEEDILGYLEAAWDDGETGLTAAALGDIARAKGMTLVAAEPTWAGRASTRRCHPTVPRSSLPSSVSSAPWPCG